MEQINLYAQVECGLQRKANRFSCAILERNLLNNSTNWLKTTARWNGDAA